MIRQFSLLNEYNQEFALNDVRTGFLDSPEGLGWEAEYSYTRFGTAFISNEITSKQAVISGNLVFATSAPYTAQQGFIRFIRNAKKLVLKRTTTAGEYLKDVDLVRYSVSEISEGGVLECPVTFMGKSLWYQPSVLTLSVGTETEEMVETIWPIEFTAVFRALRSGQVEIYNDGSNDAAVEISFYGAIANPVAVLSQDDEELARLEIPYTINAGDYIYYSSRDTNLYCYAESNGTETNLMPELSILNQNFFKVPVGNSTLQFSADSAITEPIIIKVYREYKAV